AARSRPARPATTPCRCLAHAPATAPARDRKSGLLSCEYVLRGRQKRHRKRKNSVCNARISSASILPSLVAGRQPVLPGVGLVGPIGLAVLAQRGLDVAGRIARNVDGDLFALLVEYPQ